MSAATQPIAKPQTAPPSPLAFCLAAIVLTWAGLAAAALGIKWGATPPPGDALRLSWTYVQIMQLLASAFLWPAMSWRQPGTLLRRHLILQAAALFTSALPSLVVAAFLSAVTVPVITACLALQLGIALLVMGILTAGHRAQGAAFVLFTAWIAAGPVAAFLWNNFFPRASDDWISSLPAVAVVRVAAGSATAADCWTIAGLSATLGLVLLGIPQPKRDPTRATPPNSP